MLVNAAEDYLPGVEGEVRLLATRINDRFANASMPPIRLKAQHCCLRQRQRIAERIDQHCERTVELS